MKTILQSLGACTFLVAGVTLSLAGDFSVGNIHIEHPWARPLPAVSKNGAVYMVLNNGGNTHDSLVAGTSTVSERVELHTHTHESGVMMMRPVEKVDVPPGGETRLEPGGLHIMLIGLKSPMTEGTEFQMTLQFEQAGEVEVTVAVGQP